MESSYIRLSTLVFSLFFGVLLSVISKKIKIPAIAPLLFGGILLGPAFLGIVNTAHMEDDLRLIISLSLAVILFEGGITLDTSGFIKSKKTIIRLLSVGVLVTWLGSALLVYFIFGFSIELSLLAGSLIIVTGPTVIVPLLQRINVNEKLHHILHWEGILIDPIGVFISVLCFEWFSIQAPLTEHLLQFLLRILIGTGLGFSGGYVLYIFLKRKWLPASQSNIFVLASALALFTLSDYFVHEAGLLTVVIAGFVLGYKKIDKLKNIHQFKSELTEMAIGVLFILLAANLDLNDFTRLGWKGFILLLLVLYVIRPLNIYLSSIGNNLSFREKVFLSWMSPRGVVAGSVASLIAIQMANLGYENAYFLEVFTFSIIGLTILVQGLLSEPVAKLLKVNAPPKRRWLIIGSHFFARKIARYLNEKIKTETILLDTNSESVNIAKSENLLAFEGNALKFSSIPDEIRNSLGNILALTDNRELNQLICEKWGQFIPATNLYRWTPSETDTDTSEGFGIPIWPELGKPSKISYELESKERVIIKSKSSQASSKIVKGTVPLLQFGGSDIILNKFSFSGQGEMLLFQQIAHHLPFYILPDHIFNIESDSYNDIIMFMLNKANQIHPELDVKKTFTELTGDSHRRLTVLGHGVAIAHTHCDTLTEPICMIVRDKRGIDLEAYDAEKSKLIFVVISPMNDPGLHLILLSDIARIASDDSLVQKLLRVELKEIPELLMAN
nr:cation:proton antiporter [uncultured Sphaerochaeta sp.]